MDSLIVYMIVFIIVFMFGFVAGERYGSLVVLFMDRPYIRGERVRHKLLCKLGMHKYRKQACEVADLPHERTLTIELDACTHCEELRRSHQHYLSKIRLQAAMALIGPKGCV